MQNIWKAKVEQDDDGNLMLPLPESLFEEHGWEIGDDIEFEVLPDRKEMMLINLSHEQRLQPHDPLHPGEFIKRVYLEPFTDVSRDRVAVDLGISETDFSNLLAGKTDISLEMAARLSEVLGRSSESWLTMQDQYDSWKNKGS